MFLILLFNVIYILSFIFSIMHMVAFIFKNDLAIKTYSSIASTLIFLATICWLIDYLIKHIKFY